MKKAFTVFIFLLVLQVSVFSQTKIDEYRIFNSDNDTARIDNFILNLIRKPEAKGLFVIYSGENRARIGNILPYIKGVKTHFKYRNYNADQVSFVVATGKEVFTREMWLINKNDKIPKFKEIDYDFSDLSEKYLFSISCIGCEPAEPHLATGWIDRKLLSKILRENPEYKILLEIGKKSYSYNYEKEKLIAAKEFIENFRESFSKEYKIDKSRFNYKLVEGIDMSIYIIPSKDKKLCQN